MKTSTSVVLCALIALAAGSCGTVLTRTYLDKKTPIEVVYACAETEDGKPKVAPTEWLEYKANGTVWVRWPDGRFIEVVPHVTSR